MSSLRRDLLERKLWIVVAALLAAVVAVPVLLLKSASATSAPPLPAPPAAANTASTTTTSQTSTTSHTSTTKRPSNEPAKVVLARIARNPFAADVPKLSSTPSSTSSSSSSGSSTSSASGSSSTGSSSVSMVSPTPATGSATVGSTGSASSGSSSSSDAGSSSTSTGTTPTSTIASVSPTVPAPTAGQVQSWTIYSVSVRFGKDNAPLHNDIPRLTAMPSAGNPQVMFFGVMSGGKQAVFGLNDGTAHTGQGLCRPSHSSCSAIVLSAGQSEEVAWATDTGGMAQAMLTVNKITSRVTHSRKEALAAYNRVSKAGICDLSLSQPVSYNPATGTVQSFPKDACKAQASSAPFSFLKLKSVP